MPNVIDIAKKENQLSKRVLDHAFHIHRTLGPGLLENAYESALIYFLKKDGIAVEHQKTMPIKIDDHVISSGFRADLIVENSIICELKSIEKLAPIHEAQLLTYLKLSNIKIGLLMNFGSYLLKDGLKRLVI